MASPMHHEHSDPERLLDYLEGLLPRDMEARLEKHLDECEACRQQARQVLSFSAIWDEWTCEAPARTDPRAAVAAALVTAEARESQWLARLVIWRNQWARQARVDGRVFVRARGQASRVIGEGPRDLAFAIRTRGAVRTRGGPSAPPAAAEEAGRPEVRVEVAGADVIVHVAGSRPGPPARAPLAMLVPTAGKAEPVIQASRGPHEGEFVARFVGVEPGDYVVVVEPSGADDT